MGFFFRKSVKFGPLRFNFSKSGVGVSAGVRGARVSTGPRGTYINVGRNGFYYRQKIDIPTTQPQGHTYTNPRQGFDVAPSPQSGINFTESAGADSFTDTTLENTLSEINGKLNASAFAPIVVTFLSLTCFALLLCLAFSGIVLSEAYAYPQPGDEALISTFKTIAWSCGIAAVAVIAGIVFLTRSLRRSDKLRRTAQLFYEFDTPARVQHNKVLQAFEALGQSSLVWSQQTQQTTYDWKRNAGAGTLVSRRPIVVGRFEPPGIETNVPVCGFNFGNWQLFFMPDNIFVLSGKRYYAYPYNAVQKSLGDTRFVEDGYLPPDATVVDYTWLRVNRDGSPDRRFSYNRQIPVVRYGVIELTSASGLQVRLQVSSLQRAMEFANLWNEAFSSPGGDRKKASAGGSARAGSKEEYVNGKPAREVLGVHPGASVEEVNAAYREKAKQYHPDRVEGLGPELKTLADEKMKEVNAAYAALKKSISTAAKGNVDAGGDVTAQPTQSQASSHSADAGYVPRLYLIPLSQGSNAILWVLGAVLTFGLLLFFLAFTSQFLNMRTSMMGRVPAPSNTNVSPNINANTSANTPRPSRKPQSKVSPANKNTAAQNGNSASDVFLVAPAEEAPGESAVDYSKVFSQSEVTRKALITFKPEPGFTEEARKNNVTGVVRLRAVFSASGEVTSISVIKPLPDGLTEKAVAAAKQIHFTPAEKDGHVVSQYITLEYNFNIY
jgi:TonB family protein